LVRSDIRFCFSFCCISFSLFPVVDPLAEICEIAILDGQAMISRIQALGQRKAHQLRDGELDGRFIPFSFRANSDNCPEKVAQIPIMSEDGPFVYLSYLKGETGTIQQLQLHVSSKNQQGQYTVDDTPSSADLEKEGYSKIEVDINNKSGKGVYLCAKKTQDGRAFLDLNLIVEDLEVPETESVPTPEGFKRYIPNLNDKTAPCTYIGYRTSGKIVSATDLHWMDWSLKHSYPRLAPPKPQDKSLFNSFYRKHGFYNT